MSEVFGDAVGRVILRRIAGEICERQHDDGKMRGLGGTVRSKRKYQATAAVTNQRDDSRARSASRERRCFPARRASPQSRVSLGRGRPLVAEWGLIDLSMFLSCVVPRSVTAISSLPLTWR